MEFNNEINETNLRKVNGTGNENEEIRRNNRMYLPCHRNIPLFQEEEGGDSELKGEIHIEVICIPTFRIA